MLALLGLSLLPLACGPGALEDDLELGDAGETGDGSGESGFGESGDEGDGGEGDGGGGLPGEDVGPPGMDPAFLSCDWYRSFCYGADCTSPNGQMAITLFDEATAELAPNSDVWVTYIIVGQTSIQMEYIVARGWFASNERHAYDYEGEGEDEDNIDWERFKEGVYEDFVEPLAPQTSHEAAGELYASCKDWITYDGPCGRTYIESDGTPQLSADEYENDDWCFWTTVSVDLVTGELVECWADECQG